MADEVKNHFLLGLIISNDLYQQVKRTELTYTRKRASALKKRGGRKERVVT